MKIEIETTIMVYCLYPALIYLDRKKLLFYVLFISEPKYVQEKSC